MTVDWKGRKQSINERKLTSNWGLCGLMVQTPRCRCENTDWCEWRIHTDQEYSSNTSLLINQSRMFRRLLLKNVVNFPPEFGAFSHTTPLSPIKPPFSALSSVFAKCLFALAERESPEEWRAAETVPGRRLSSVSEINSLEILLNSNLDIQQS